MTNPRKIHSVYLIICVLFLLLFILCSLYYTHCTFFQRLSYDDVSSIHIYSKFSEDGTLQCTELSDEDAQTVFQLINQISLSGFGKTDFDEYVGVWLYGYRITLNNGRSIEVAPNGSLLVLNQRRSFRIDYDLGTALGELRADLDDAYFLNNMLP